MFKASVITVSTRGHAGKREDESGPVVSEILKNIGIETVSYKVVPDNKAIIKEKLIELSHISDLIITTGGTGLTPDDVTPDATSEVIEREIPGMAEAMRAEGLKKTDRSMLSRAVVGVYKQTLIINLPGSTKAVRENLAVVTGVIPHALEKIKGSHADCARS
ncbi:MAG: MogA/MoaB family molybdenum cofactor biosynthesis protein [Nitrospirae bacterium]|nr:MogA/MoaB family molybdenum cofactor biosynthesis protein [Nitrospirota bacterium]MBF0534917.1 MogA/MoaB family molybdenum cofactor biosynthesis protein [Nitrospirota bacterium]MBF0617232.1 MogA/MoaB family molybdenum cofactor biosynthesis protein [Nitrospirota bacterium]